MEQREKQSNPKPTPSVAPESDEVRIPLPERFTFQDHRVFRAGYFNGRPPATRYVVDFVKTRFIDSAGLGMLLQLGEYVMGDPARLRLVNCTSEIRQTLVVAGFDQVATIA